MLHLLLFLTTVAICSDSTRELIKETACNTELGNFAVVFTNNYFQDCIRKSIILGPNIKAQLKSKKLNDTGFKYIANHIEEFANAYACLLARFPNKRLLKSFMGITQVQLHATQTVIYNEDCSSLEEYNYAEWKRLSEKNQKDLLHFLKSHEPFYDIYLDQNDLNPYKYSDENLNALHTFSLHYLFISNMYDLSKKHKKEINKLNKPFSIYNCSIV